MNFLIPLAQVFGGCCCNVYSFEALLDQGKRLPEHPDVGHVVTLLQFMLVSLVAVRPHLVRHGFFYTFRRPKIPLSRHMVSVGLFFAVLVLNNSVWRFGVSVPIHITLRSSAACVTMAVGYVFGGKRYTRSQICALVLMLAGSAMVVCQKAQDSHSTLDGLRYFVGVGVLVAALVLGAFLGLYNERLYRKYGTHWQETLFYSHALALPLFLLLGRGVWTDLVTMCRSGPFYSLETWASLFSLFGSSKTLDNFLVLRPALLLALNAATQVVCARGVNQLAGRALSLTVVVVLLVRKFLSLVLSSVVFGNRFNLQGYMGSLLLVAGTIQYAMATYKKEKVH